MRPRRNDLPKAIHDGFAVLVIYSLGCVRVLRAADCGAEHYQTKLCRADFVLKTQLKRPAADQPFPGWVAMEMRIKNQIKINEAFQQISDEGLGRILLSNAMYEKVENKTKYIVSGALMTIADRAVLAATDCDWLQPWAALTHRVKGNLRKQKYLHNCQCSITDAHRPGHKLACSSAPASSNSSQASGEQWATAAAECYRLHAHCRMPDGGGGGNGNRTHFRYSRAAACKWTSNKELKRCLQCAREGSCS